MKKFPLILQRDAIQCGVSCLQMICKYYGQSYSFEELEKICIPTVEGISLLGVKDAAETLGLSTTCCQLSLNALKKFHFLAFCIGTKIILLSCINTSRGNSI